MYVYKGREVFSFNAISLLKDVLTALFLLIYFFILTFILHFFLIAHILCAN